MIFLAIHLLASLVVLVLPSTSSTLVYSSRLAGGHGHPELEALKTVEHYELHDLSSLIRAQRRRRLSEYGSSATLKLHVLGRKLDVALARDDELFTPTYRHSLQDEHGNEVANEGPLDCIFRAELDGGKSKGSFALCDDQEMLATMLGEHSFSIEPVQVPARNSAGGLQVLHAIYWLDDSAAPSNFTSGVVEIPMRDMQNTNAATNTTRASVFLDSKIKYVGLLQVNDAAFYKAYRDRTAVRSAQIIAMVKSFYNLMPKSAVYRIKIALARMITFVVKDPYTNLPFDQYFDGYSYLPIAGGWLIQSGLQVDLAHFSSGLQTLGIGPRSFTFQSAACYSGLNVAITYVGPPSTFDRSPIYAASGIGHLLGARSDTIPVPSLRNKTCRSKTSIMSMNGRRFTECTLEWFRLNFAPQSPVWPKYNTEWLPPCLETPDYDEILDVNAPVCGNGLIEAGEQCDCAGRDCSAIDPCCDGATCRLKPNAKCPGAFPCCDSETCDFKPATTVCRSLTDSCDAAEYCSGTSYECPENDRLPLGTACTDALYGDGEHFDGYCTCQGCASHISACFFNGWTTLCPPIITEGHRTCRNLVRCSNNGSNSNPISGCLGVDWLPDGMPCGTNRFCMKKSCVPASKVVCPWMSSPAPRPSKLPAKKPTSKRRTAKP